MNLTPPRDESAPVWSRHLLTELDDADRRAIALVRGATSTELNWRPSPAEWSVGQCIEHLCITSEVYLPSIIEALAGRPRGFAQDIKPGWFGGWFLRSFIEPSADSRPQRAPGKIAPSATPVDPAILDRFLARNDKVREVVQHAASYDVNRIRFRNPLMPVIHFTIGTGLLILVRHEHRHLLQAERVKPRLADHTRSRY